MTERTDTPGRDGDTPSPADPPAYLFFTLAVDEPSATPARKRRSTETITERLASAQPSTAPPRPREYPSFPPPPPLKADDLDKDAAAGFDTVEKIAALYQQISSLNAEMLEHIAELRNSPCLEPGPRPPATSKEAERTGRALEGLTRDDMTEAVLIERLHTGKHTTWELIQTANGLTTRLPRTLQALKDGRLDYRRAVIISKKLQLLAEDHYEAALKAGISPAAAEQVARDSVTAIEDALFEKVSRHTPAQVHKDVDRAIHKIDPGFAKRHARDNVKGRNVRHRSNSGDATGDIYAHLGAPEALAVFNVIDSYARAARQNGAKRSLDELRADAFSHLILHGHLPDGSTPDLPLNTENATIIKQEDEIHPSEPAAGFFGHPESASAEEPFAEPNETVDSTVAANATADRAESSDPTLPTETNPLPDAPTADAADRRPTQYSRGGSGPRTHVQITIGLETLMGLNDDPADLTGHGPITADTARDLAYNAGSIWRRLVTDPLSGQLLDYGRKTYRPPVGLADFVRARDVTCRTPSCDRPADTSHLDHIIPWPAGTTSEQNLHAKCDHDHTLKHQGRWKHQVSTDPNHPRGTVIMISPTGHIYLSFPYTYRQPMSGTNIESFTTEVIADFSERGPQDQNTPAREPGTQEPGTQEPGFDGSEPPF